MTTFSAKPAEVRREWFVVDATGKTLGRLSTEIARRLRGKHKPEYTPHVDTGDYIVVINAEKVRVTGNKLKDKIYYHHTGYIGNLKSISLEKQLVKAPERVIEGAVKGMLPRSVDLYGLRFNQNLNVMNSKPRCSVLFVCMGNIFLHQ